MAFSNKQQLNSMESSVQSLEVLIGTKQDILDDDTKNEVSLLKLTATNLYAGIFYYLGQPLEQLLGNKQNLLSNNTDVDMRQVSCTNLTVNDSNIVSAINLKQNIIDTTKDVQMRNLMCNDVQMQNLTCNSVEIDGNDVISSLNAKQDIIQDGDLTIDRTTGLQKTFDDLNDVLDTKQDTISSSTELSLKSLTVGGSDFVSIQAIGPGPPSESPNIGEIQCESLVINYGLNVEEKFNEHATSISSLEEQINDNNNAIANETTEFQDKLDLKLDSSVLNSRLQCNDGLSSNGVFYFQNSGSTWIRRYSLAMEFSTYCNNYGEGLNSGEFHFWTGKPGNGYGLKVRITESGRFYSNGTSNMSDDRLKHNETDILNGLKIIRQLKPQKYQKTTTMKEENYNGTLEEPYSEEAGFIAQDVLKIDELSYCVSDGDYYDASDNLTQRPYSLDYNSVFTYAVSAIKELDTQLQSEKLKYEDLLKRVLELESK